MNKDLYDPTGKQPSKVTHFAVSSLASAASRAANAEATAVADREALQEAMEAFHATGHDQRKMGLLTAKQIAEATGLSVKRIEQVLKERREARNEAAKEAAAARNGD